MTLLRSLIMAISCFSQIPVPQVEWKPESMRYMMGFFPAVGVIIALLLAGWVWLCSALGFGTILQAAGIALVPICVTGGIHMDGFADTCDALASNAPPEKRRQILKDPHAGAFAIIGVVAYVLAYFAFATEFDSSRALAQLMVVPVLVRTLSGIATVKFPLSAGRGMLADEQESSAKGRVFAALIVVACLCVGLLVWLNPVCSLVMVCIAAACLGGLYALSQRTFGGMSGDLAGFFLQVCELALLVGIVVVFKFV